MSAKKILSGLVIVTSRPATERTSLRSGMAATIRPAVEGSAGSHRGLEALAQVGGYTGLVADSFVQMEGVGPVTSGGQLDEGAVGVAGDLVGRGQQVVADAALAHAGVDDQGHHARDAIAVLEP